MTDARDEHLRIRLRANPTRRQSAHRRPNATRLPITSWDERLARLKRKLAEAAADPIEQTFNIVSQPRDTGHANGHHITVWPVLFARPAARDPAEGAAPGRR
jgi:hypothetical protein